MTVQRVRSPRAADFVAGLKNGDLDHAKRARRLIVGISGRHRNRLWHWDFGGSARGFHRDTLGGVKSRRHDSSIRDRVVIPTTAPAGGRDARDRRRRGCDCDRFVQNNGEGHRPALRENRRRDRESSHEQLCCPGGLRRAEGTAPLVLLLRESPLTAIHSRNMLAVTESGGVIAPPVPAFLRSSSDLDDVVEHTVGGVLDLWYRHRLSSLGREVEAGYLRPSRSTF